MENKLTPKQQRFCDEYLIDFNATQACLRAGYSERSAGQIGEQNLKKLEIQAYIASKKEKTATKLEITKESLIMALNGILMDDSAKHNDKINSIKVMNQMLGFNEATRQETKITGINTSLKDLMGFDDE